MNDQDIEQLLKTAGAREKPPADVEHAVRKQLHQEWRAVVTDRSRHGRRRTIVALAAGVFAAAIGIGIIAFRSSGPGDVVATVALASGELRVTSGWLDGWHEVVDGQQLREGQILETGQSGRGALALSDGVSARLDTETRLVMSATDRLNLDRGALYVDSGAGKTTSKLDVMTSSGSVRHIGTQYEVRLLESGVRLSVRDGRIEWRSKGGAVEHSQSGEQLTISDDGRVERQPLPRYGAPWDWAAATTPAIDIEGMPLATFLSWAARELGRDVVYASPAVAADVEGVVVHGSISGLNPEQALDAVLATTTVRAVLDGGHIVIEPGGQSLQ